MRAPARETMTTCGPVAQHVKPSRASSAEAARLTVEAHMLSHLTPEAEHPDV